MHFDPIKVEEEVKWPLRPRKFKRKCEYLENNKEEEQINRKEKEECFNNKILMLLPPKEPKTIINNSLSSKKICLPTRKVSFPIKITFYSLISMLHFILNLFIVSVIILFVGYFAFCTGRDISYKVSLKKSEAKILMEEAKNLYFLNKCDPTTRVPALQQQCDQWDHMTKYGFSSIKYTKIVVEMFADVLDGFVSKFKVKSLAVIVTFMSVYLLFRRRSV